MALPYPAGKALTVEQVRELDVLAIEHAGLPGIVLMENAGRGIAEFVYNVLPDPDIDRVLILCGAGNNAGDGFVVARHLYNAGVNADVVLTVPPERISGDAETNLKILQRMNFEFIRAFEPQGLVAMRHAVEDAEVIVDALLGTGSNGDPRDLMATVIEHANAAPRARRFAIDLPSGLNADSGRINSPCFQAAVTLTMVAPKTGFEVPAAREVVGRVVTIDIGVPRALIPGRREVDRRG
jgi:NAD(P)H-hydrate epimerase